MVVKNAIELSFPHLNTKVGNSKVSCDDACHHKIKNCRFHTVYVYIGFGHIIE
jgi:hypothetical protein